MPHDPCPICRNEMINPSSVERGVCDACSAMFGIVAMPAPTRPAAPCERCGNRSFYRALPRELSVTTGMVDKNEARHTPMFVTYVPQAQSKIFGSGYKPVELDPFMGRGLVEMYICQACRFVEWYAHGEIPVGPQYMVDVVEYEPEPPYR